MPEIEESKVECGSCKNYQICIACNEEAICCNCYIGNCKFDLSKEK